MDKITLSALCATIEHWHEVYADPLYVPYTRADTPLCRVYAPIYIRDETNHCIGCPVHDLTGRKGCIGTPWLEVRRSILAAQNRHPPRLAYPRLPIKQMIAVFVDLLPDPVE